MRKKTNRIIYAILGFLAIVFAILGIFSIIKRRVDFLKEGNARMAEFSITFGVALLGIALLSAVLITWLLRRDRKIQFLQDSLFSELGKSPAFKTWFLQEEAQLKKQYGLSRKIGVSFSVILGTMMFFYFLLVLEYSIGGALTGVCFLIGIGGIVFLLRFTDYNRNYIDPMLESVSLTLPSPSAREAFANQMKGKQKRQFMYSKAPRSYPSTAFIMQDYCFFRQFRSSRVIINAQIRKIVLKRVSYTVNALGYLPHFRSCYEMEMYLDSDSLKKPAWQGYFDKQEAVYQALSLVQSAGLAEKEIVDQIGEG